MRRIFQRIHQVTSDSDRRNLFIVTTWLLLIAVGGTLVILLNTPWGIGVYHDSIYYLTSAKNFASGDGLQWVASGGALKPLTHFPPLYPLSLALPSMLGFNTIAAARWLSALLLGLNAAIAGLIVFAHTRRLWPVFVAPLMVLASPILLEWHFHALSEPLFFLSTMSALALMAMYLQNPNPRTLIVAAVATSLGYLTRYVGISILATGCIGLLLLSGDRLRLRLRNVILYFFVSILPMGLWMIRNWIITGSLTNRTFRYHPLVTERYEDVSDVLFAWMTNLELPFKRQYAVLLALFAIMGVLLLYRFRKEKSPLQPKPYLGILLAVFICASLVSLWISLTFFDASIRIDNRILAPVYLAGLLLTILIMGLYTPRGNSRWLYIGIVAALLFSHSRHLWNDSLSLLETANADGFGFTGRSWQQSETIAWLQTAPSEAVIYTNERPAVHFLTDRGPYPIPEKMDPVQSTERPDYQDNMESMFVKLNESIGFLIVFHPDQIRPGMPTLDEMTTGLILLHEFDDALVFVDPVNLAFEE